MAIVVFAVFFTWRFFLNKTLLPESQKSPVDSSRLILTPEQEKELINRMSASSNTSLNLNEKTQINAAMSVSTSSRSSLSEEDLDKIIKSTTAK